MMLKFLNGWKKVVFYPCIFQKLSYFINNISAHPYKIIILTGKKMPSRAFISVEGTISAQQRKMQEKGNMVLIWAKQKAPLSISDLGA